MAAPALSADIRHCFGFAVIQIHLPLFGGLLRIHTGPEPVFFGKKIPPAYLAVFRTLHLFETTHSRFCAGQAFNNLYHSSRVVSSDIVSDDGVASGEFVACQVDSVSRVTETSMWPVPDAAS